VSHKSLRKLPSLQKQAQLTTCQADSFPASVVIPPISESTCSPLIGACGGDLQSSPLPHPAFPAQGSKHGETNKCHPNGPQLDVIKENCQNSTDPVQIDLANSKLTAPAGLFKKHRNLIELLNQKESSQQNTAPKQANRVDLPEGSKSLFRHFLRGYVGTTLVHAKQTTKHPTSEEFALSNLFGEVDHSLGEEPLRDATQGDHYDYFSRVPVPNAGSLHDQSRRLQCMRMLNRRDRVVRQKSRDISIGVVASISGPEYAHDCTQSPSSQVDGGLIHGSTASGTSPTSGSSFRGRHSAVQAHQTIKASTTQALKADMRTRKACESLRDLIFGIEYTEARRSEGTGAFYEQKCGTKQEVMLLHMKWTQMDTDGSGDVGYKEFLDFFSHSKSDRLCGMRCVNYFVEKNKREGIDDEEGGCTIEDIMRLLWLKATDQDVKKMMNWFEEAELQKERIPQPPLLPERKKQQILANFPSFAKEKKHTISFSELLASGLFTEGALMVVEEQFGKELTKGMTQEELLEILCPNGYLAHKDVKQAVDVEGRPLAWVTNKIFTGWVVVGTQKGQGKSPVARVCLDV